MKILYTLGLSFVLFTYTAIAQITPSVGTLSGNITDESKKNLDYVTVVLFQQADSTVVKTAFTDADGKFQFGQIPFGTYYIKANMMGYSVLKSKPIVLDANNKNISFNTLILTATSKVLNEVSIVTAKPLFERKIDKVVMNVESSSIMVGSSALEVLQKAPGVTVDQNDKISMMGKQGVLIQIDGKQTYMSSADVASMLRNMPSNQIETIELITNPSSKYDASGNSGIINIRTKKQRNGGTNGTITAGAGLGRYLRKNSALSLNHRTQLLNVFGSYNYEDVKRFQETSIDRISTQNGSNTFFDQNGNDIDKNYNNYFKAGIDLFLNKNNTIGFLVNGYANKNRSESENKTFIGSERLKVDSSLFADNIFNSKFQNLSYNLNYKSNLDTNGQELTVDLDYSKYKGRQQADYINRHLYADGSELRPATYMNNQSPSDIEIKAFKSDYTLPINKTMKLETGIKASLVKTDNNFKFEDEFNGKGSNHFIYSEDVYAAYFNLSKEFKKTTIQVGLRAEQTSSLGNSVNKNIRNKRDYLNFFPTVFINQTLSDKHSLGASYSRRIDRPGYDALNPFIFYLDQYTYNQGNEFLRPQYTDNYELTYTFLQKYSLTVNYSDIKDAIIEAILPNDEKKALYQTNVNVKSNTAYGANLNVPVAIAKWWQTNNNLNVFHLTYNEPNLGGQALNTGKTSFQFKSNHSFTIRKDMSAELSGNYESPLEYGTLSLKARYGIDMGLSKSFMDKKLNLKLALNDVFNIRRTKLSSAYPGFNYTLNQKNESQIGRISLTYRFGSNDVKPARRRSTGVESETGRMKN